MEKPNKAFYKQSRYAWSSNNMRWLPEVEKLRYEEASPCEAGKRCGRELDDGSFRNIRKNKSELVFDRLYLIITK